MVTNLPPFVPSAEPVLQEIREATGVGDLLRIYKSPGGASLFEKMKNNFKSIAFEEENLVLFALGSGIGAACPSPSDIAYFYIERWLDQNRYKIDPKTFWALRLLNYYVVDSSFWFILWLWLLISDRPAHEKMKIYLYVLAAGVVSVMAFKFMQDEGSERDELEKKITSQRGKPETLEEAEFLRQTGEAKSLSAPSSVDEEEWWDDELLLVPVDTRTKIYEMSKMKLKPSGRCLTAKEISSVYEIREDLVEGIIKWYRREEENGEGYSEDPFDRFGCGSGVVG